MLLDIPDFLIKEQMQCLTEAIYYEARGESFAGQVFVGFVIRNRVTSKIYPNGFCSVLEQPYQFSYNNGRSILSMPDEESRKQAEEVAYMVFNTDPTPIPTNVLYYHTLYVKPNWSYNLLQEYMTYGDHVFYQLK